jgi:hypothetical protein
MAGMNRGGEILPGFDCETGKAIGFTAAEWFYRTKAMTRVYDGFTMTVRVYDKDKLRYEIFASEFQLR